MGRFAGDWKRKETMKHAASIVSSVLSISYVVAGTMRPQLEWLDGDGKEDTAEGFFVLLRILPALRVGFRMGLDAGDQIAIIAGCEAAELSSHGGCGFPGFVGLEGGLSRAQSKLADWVAVNVHDMLPL
jgi:hypothetical protein